MTRCVAAIGSLHNASYVGPWVGSRMRGPVVFEVRRTRGGRLRLESLWVSPSVRGRGIGNDMLQLIARTCDWFGVECELVPRPFDGRPVKVAELRAWYARHGFEVDRGQPGGLKR